MLCGRVLYQYAQSQGGREQLEGFLIYIGCGTNVWSDYRNIVYLAKCMYVFT